MSDIRPDLKTPAAPASSGADPGAVPHVPDYELLRRIGGGSYGEVWLARNVMGAYRAVKMVYRRTFPDERPFEREFSGIQKFEPISRLHDSQVDILHVGRNEDGFYYVMELADDAGGDSEKVGKWESEGRVRNPPAHSPTFSPAKYEPRTLKLDLSRRGPLPLEECVAIALALTTALEHLHQHGLAHRDIKPSNIIFVGGMPKLADIGLVTDIDATHSFVGTEGYIPPEGPGTPQADLYSLGKVLYEISTGKDRQDFPDPPTYWEGNADEKALLEFHEVLLKAGEPDARRRYQSAREMRADLALLQSGKSVRRLRVIERRLNIATKVSVVTGSLALLALAAFLGSLKQSHRADRIAKEETRQRQLAEQANRQNQDVNAQLTETLTRLEIQKAEDSLTAEETPTALAYLARLLRQQPTNQVVGQRIISALSHRHLALPLTGPIPHPAPVYSAKFTPDDRFFLTWASDHKARIWDARTGAPPTNGIPAEFESNSTLFSVRGERLVVASSNEVRAVDFGSEGTEFPPIRLDGTVIKLQFLAGEECFVTLTLDGTTQLWDAQTGEAKSPARRLQIERDVAPIRYATLSTDAKKVATVHSNYVAYLWDADTGQVLTPPLAYHFGGTAMSLGYQSRPRALCDDASTSRPCRRGTIQP